LEECEIFGNTYSGIEIADQGDAYVIKSKLHQGTSVGITAWRNGSVTVEESLIFENTTMGLLLAGAGRAVVRKSVFRANGYAGIEMANGSDPQIDGCQIFGGRGTGMFFHDNAKGRVDDCSIFGNLNANVVITSGSNPEIHNSRFSESGQAGLLISGGLGTIADCKILNNYVGVEIKENGAPTIQHCQINANRSQGLTAESDSAGSVTASDLSRNSGGPWKIGSGSQLIRNQNVE
jgi:F-box protein 11